MCVPCEAAKERLRAAQALREVVEVKYGLSPALRLIFPLPENTDELMRLVAKLDT